MTSWLHLKQIYYQCLKNLHRFKVKINYPTTNDPLVKKFERKDGREEVLGSHCLSGIGQRLRFSAHMLTYMVMEQSTSKYLIWFEWNLHCVSSCVVDKQDTCFDPKDQNILELCVHELFAKAAAGALLVTLYYKALFCYSIYLFMKNIFIMTKLFSL